ncbi:MAG TPA: hypothetical protein VJI97_04150 [Candidatus Nanoarchaeia archaeon]|nr:hypothetical protein [Candidatus Nanoarchaeia archaeon]
MSDASHQDAQPDYSGVMKTYEGLKGQGLKAEADAVMKEISGKYTAEHPAPPEEIQHGLEALVKKHEHSHPSPTHSKQAPQRTVLDTLVKLAAAAAIVGLVAGGIPPYMPPIY